jgi:conjugal transfer mating pair stabilization protein TraN
VTKGPLNRSSCGEGCIQVWIGQVGDNYWSGYCAIYQTETWLQINNPDAIISAKLDYATWDDYMLITLNNQPVYAGPYGGDRLEIYEPECDPNVDMCFGTKRVKYSATGYGSCELGTSWVTNPNVNVTSSFKNVAPGGVLKFKNKVEVAGGGEGYARITIRFDPKKVITEGEWYPDECKEMLELASDGFCSASYGCTRMPQNYGNGCITKEATTVCDGTASTVFDVPPGFSGSPFCQKVDVSLDCNNFYTGDMTCWTDPQGVEHCPSNDGGNLQQCAALENNPACAYMGRECVDGARGESGECYVWTEKFDCGYDTTYSALTALTSYSCNGPVSCFGADCIDPAFESSSSYGKALAATQAAEFMAMDLSCTGTDGTQNVVCSVFDGDPMKCKIAVGGVVDCCQRPSGISLANYISLIMGVRRLDTMLTSPGLNNTALQGAWEVIREPVTSTWSAIKEPLTSAWDSLWGGTEATASEAAKEGVLGNFKQEIMNEVANWVGETFGGAARDALFTQSSAGNYAFGGTVGTALTYIYYAYMIYMIVMLVIQLIWECEESEFELGAKRELKSCHYVGSYCASDTPFGCIEKRDSYCCFNSPLSRIIQEQVRPQLGMSWGTAESPSCGGVPTDKLMDVDWAQVNLDEWLGILNITGNLPSTSDLDMESLTGSGSAWSAGSDHESAADRAVQRLEGIDTTDVRQTARDEL